MKRAVSVVLQMVLYLAVYAVGCILPAVHKLPEWTVTMSSGRLFVLDGLVFMTIVFVLIVGTQAARRRLQHAWAAPILAFVLSVVLLLATRFPLALISPSSGTMM